MNEVEQMMPRYIYKKPVHSIAPAVTNSPRNSKNTLEKHFQKQNSVGGPRDNCNEKGKSDKDKYQMISLICGLLKNDTD